MDNDEYRHDKSKSRLNIHEGFHKAKRNSLSWSAVFLLASLSKGNDGNVKLALLQTEYPIWLIITFSMLVSIFMLFGYRRAEELLIANNSKMLADLNADGLPEAFLKLKQIAEKIGDRYIGLQKEISQISSDVHKIDTQIGHDLDRNSLAVGEIAYAADQRSDSLNIQLDEYLSELFTCHKTELGRISDDIRKTFKNKSNAFDEAFHDMRQRSSNIKASLDRYGNEVKALETEIYSIPERIERSLSNISGFSRDIKAMSGDIRRGDQLYYKMHDRWPTYGLFFFALGAALYHYFILLKFAVLSLSN